MQVHLHLHSSPAICSSSSSKLCWSCILVVKSATFFFSVGFAMVCGCPYLRRG
uniref:Uncharacterized protein n=1 Tax=Arundo donax TaxID=35708 RepID=A0A0A9EWT4_ARUDO